MSFDTTSWFELVLAAAVSGTLVTTGLFRDSRSRLRFGAALALWFLLALTITLTQALRRLGPLGVAGLGLMVTAPITTWAWAAARSRSLRQGIEAAPLPRLIAVQVFRVLGVNFLVLHAAHRLGSPFALLAGWGDFLTGVDALAVAWLARAGADRYRWAILAWNTFGLLDLVVAVTLGATSAPGPIRVFLAEPGTALMTSAPWLLIPGFLVPFYLSLHLAVFYRLRAGRARPAVPGALGAGA